VIGYEADQIARGGVFVCLGYDGTARIERGFVRPEDEVPQQEETEGADGEVIEDASSPDPADDGDEEEREGDPGQPISDLLTRDLTAHRTLGLRLALGEQPDMALIAVTHALATRSFIAAWTPTPSKFARAAFPWQPCGRQ